jgi:hypothetical protein
MLAHSDFHHHAISPLHTLLDAFDEFGTLPSDLTYSRQSSRYFPDVKSEFQY